ncbi:hypothetical protein FACS1894191_6120 [Clostridia bacterium]|nr:hypothetical protein FACS1894191_6120 [Clostridia bacterium]
MNSDFPRVLTLLRKEKGISQKSAAAELMVSQALLSHYEKGIRECGLDFLVRCADFYSVSCDYLLGRSPDRTGSTITVEDIPDPEDDGKNNRSITTVLPQLSKKLIFNSLNVLFDLLTRSSSKSLTGEVSAFLMLAVYRMFRIVYSANPKNNDEMFNVPANVCSQYAGAAMYISEGNAAAIVMGQPLPGASPIPDIEELSLSTKTLEENYPLFSPSLFNLIQNSENRIGYAEKPRR